ncbi:hypothetical protein EON63_19745 [archaeon]|nr:MAG: hypothetical protein EON63_19745 [archaeon]
MLLYVLMHSHTQDIHHHTYLSSIPYTHTLNTCRVEDALRQMLLDNDEDKLPDHRIRNPSYSGLQFGPVKDTSSVRYNEVRTTKHIIQHHVQSYTIHHTPLYIIHHTSFTIYHTYTPYTIHYTPYPRL